MGEEQLVAVLTLQPSFIIHLAQKGILRLQLGEFPYHMDTNFTRIHRYKTIYTRELDI